LNLLILILFGIGSLAVLWVVQSLLLFLQGADDPLRGLLHVRDASRFVRRTMAVVLQLVLVGFLFGYPLAVGEKPLTYHENKLLPAHPGHFVEALLVALCCFVVGTAVEIQAGWVRFERRYPASQSTSKILQSFLRPLPLAFVEEGIFRGIVLEQMVLAMPSGVFATVAATVLSAAVFSAVHFIRPAKTYGPAVGLFVLSCLLGIAYLVGGHTYWLPVGLHAGGILSIKLLLPFVQYRGPAWLIGYRSYPIAGAIGVGVMIFLSLYIVARFGGIA
jgi:CAAX prenyl protease-like protein